MFTMRTYERCTRRLTERALGATATYNRWQKDAHTIKLVNRRAVRENHWPVRKHWLDNIGDRLSGWAS